MAGGLGRYLGIDPVILRIAFVVLAVFGGSGVLLYIVGWIAIPEESPGDDLGPAPASGAGAGRAALGVALVVVGLIWLASRLLPGFDDYIGPLVLVALGVALIVGTRR